MSPPALTPKGFAPEKDCTATKGIATSTTPMFRVLLPMIALSTAPATGAAETVPTPVRKVSPSVRKAIARADLALGGLGVPARSLYRGDLASRMRRLPPSPPPAEPVMRTFDYELLARIVTANKLKREQRQAAGIAERYRGPGPNYLSGSGVMAAASSRSTDREAIAKARRQLRRISLQRRASLPRPST